MKIHPYIQEMRYLEENHNRSFTQMIRSRKHLVDFVNTNHNVDDSHDFKYKLFSVMRMYTPICPFGNWSGLLRFKDGPRFCDNKCTCAQLSRGKNSSNSLLGRSPDEVAATNAKREATNINRYGVPFQMQRPEMKHYIEFSPLSQDKLDKLHSYDFMYHHYVELGLSALAVGKIIGVHYSTVHYHCHKHGIPLKLVSNRSYAEHLVIEFLEELGYEVEHTVLGLSYGKSHVDINIPEKNLSIEIDGLLYHSFPSVRTWKNNPRDYHYKHQKKTIACEENGSTLIHLTDYDIERMFDQSMAYILRQLGELVEVDISDNPLLNEIDRETAMEFIRNNSTTHFVTGDKFYAVGNDEYKVAAVYDVTVEDDKVVVNSITTDIRHSLKNWELAVNMIAKSNKAKSSEVWIDYSKQGKIVDSDWKFELDQVTEPYTVWNNGTSYVDIPIGTSVADAVGYEVDDEDTLATLMAENLMGYSNAGYLVYRREYK